MAHNTALATTFSVSHADAERQSFAWLIALHLVPGVLATIVYVIVAPLAIGRGFPPLLARKVPELALSAR